MSYEAFKNVPKLQLYIFFSKPGFLDLDPYNVFEHIFYQSQFRVLLNYPFKCRAMSEVPTNLVDLVLG